MTDSDNQAQAGHYERPEEASSGKALVNLWLDAIELSAKEESDWLKDGKEAFQVYTADEAALKGTTFNLYFANVETTVPALYNSTPIPDVRRRFNDKDPVAKDGSDAIERVLSYVVDEYDFDDVIRAAVYHYTVAGRGVVRVTYQAHMQQIGMDPMTGEPVEDVGAQTVACRTVPWAGLTWCGCPRSTARPSSWMKPCRKSPTRKPRKAMPRRRKFSSARWFGRYGIRPSARCCSLPLASRRTFWRKLMTRSGFPGFSPCPAP